MKLLKVNVLAIGIALAASGPASAALFNGTTGNGSVFLSVYDTTAQVTYVKDLNIRLNDFLAPQASSFLSYNLAGDANWTSFRSAAGSTDDVIYNVVALDSVGNRFLSTSTEATINAPASTIDGTSGTTNLSLKSFKNVDNYVNALNAILGASDSSLVHVQAGATDFAAFGVGFRPAASGKDWAGLASFNTAAGLDTALSFYQLGLNGASLVTKISAVGYGQEWKLTSDGALTYGVAAVPEPGTWAMLAAGLVTIGGIARRRVAS